MPTNLLSQKYLHDEDAAHAHLIKMRWPNGITCVHCQANTIYQLNVRASKRRVLKCGKCRKQFSATVGTIFEDSHVPLTKWFMTLHLMCSSKKSMSAHQLHRMLGVTYKTAWFMAHRLRHAMTQFVSDVPPLTGIVECDETYIGGKDRGAGQGNRDNKVPVFALVQRGGKVRSMVMPRVTARNLKTAVQQNVDRSAQLMTDSFIGYKEMGKDFASHDIVNHSEGECARYGPHEYN